MTKRFRSILFLSALLLVASAVAGIAQPRLGRAADTPAKKTITVTGNGTVTTVPDRAAFDFSVTSQGATAKAALAKNADEATAVIAALKNAGIAAADLQTGQVSLSPQFNQAGTDVVGYVASNTVSAKTTIAKAGSIVDAAVNAGANGVSGPSLSRSDSDALYRAALKNAVADAGEKAKTLAAASGLTLGGVQVVVEGAQSSPPIPFAAAKDSVGSVTPVEPGTQEVAASVTVTYDAS
jgi:uncharacterized protein YggE